MASDGIEFTCDLSLLSDMQGADCEGGGLKLKLISMGLGILPGGAEDESYAILLIVD